MSKTKVHGSKDSMAIKSTKEVIKKCAQQVIKRNRAVFDELADL